MMYWKIKHDDIKIPYTHTHTHTWIAEENEETQPTSICLPEQRNLVGYNQ